jgi:hypothetical protein
MNGRRHIVAIFALVGVSLSAQQPPPGAARGVGAQPPTFKLAVNYVEVDAVVTDAGGKPVRDLTKGDFRLFEDGKPQDISSFSVVDLPIDFDHPLPAETAITSDVASNAHAPQERAWQRARAAGLLRGGRPSSRSQIDASVVTERNGAPIKTRVDVMIQLRCESAAAAGL